MVPSPPAGPTAPPERTALVLVEYIYGHMHPDHGAGRVAREEGLDTGYFYDRCWSTVVPNTRALARALRRAGGTVAVTSTATAWGDFRDIAPGVRPVIRRRGHRAGERDAEVLEEVAGLCDLVVTKAGSGTWATTSLDDTLRAAGVAAVVLAGVHTHGAVLMSAHWAWDLGYAVTVVEDACATLGRAPHERAVALYEAWGVAVAGTRALCAAWDGQPPGEMTKREDHHG